MPCLRQGDYIDITIGTGLGITTMAAAALGNTVSDLAGIGSAWYVENIAVKIGIKPPELSPEQLESKGARWSANGVRFDGAHGRLSQKLECFCSVTRAQSSTELFPCRT